MRFSQKLSNKKVYLLLLLSGLLIFGRSIFNSFVWDDEEQILNNTSIKSFKNIPSFFKQSTFNPGGAANMGGLYYKPLMTTAFTLIYPISGGTAHIYHLFQILLHITNSFLIYLILQHFFKRKKLSFALSLLFLIHPINAQPAIYISSYQDTLFFFFGSLALLHVLKNPLPILKNLAIVSLFLLFSILSKETGIIFFALIFFYNFIFAKKEAKKYILSFFTSLGIYSILRFGLAGIFFQKHGLTPISRTNLIQRLSSIPKIFFYYLKTTLFPKKLAISQHWIVENLTLSSFWLPLTASLVFLFLIIFGYFQLKSKKNKKIYLFFSLIFILGISLHLQIFSLDLTVSNRWFYLPFLGLLGMLGTWLQKNSLKGWNKQIAFAILTLIYLSLSLRTFARTLKWKNGLTLYQNDLKISSKSFDLQNNYGVELYRQDKKQKSLKHFKESINLAPHWWTNWNNAGVVLEEQGKLQQALSYYQKAIENGDYYLAHQNRARIALTKLENYSKTEVFLTDSLKKLPNNLTLWKYYIQLKLKQGKTKEAQKIANSLYNQMPNQQTYQLLQLILQEE